jgi:hypothetical protein
LGHFVRRVFQRLARHKVGLATSLAVPFLLFPDVAQTPAYKFVWHPHQPPAPATPAQLAALRSQALIGSNAQLAAYARADIATHWPQLNGRIVLLQGNGPDATDWNSFYRDFSRAYAYAIGTPPERPPDTLHREISLSWQVVQSANAGGTMVTYPATVDGHSIPVIALPLVACRACVNAQLEPSTQNCQPLHPDTPYFEGLYRLRNIYHEQAHALRMLRGLYRWQTDRDIHREEVIAELFGDARLAQSVGDVGLNVVRRGQILLPVTLAKSRHYYALPGRDMLLRWLEQNKAELPKLHPDALLEQVTAIAEKTLLSPRALLDLQKVESQRELLRLDSAQRLQLAQAAAESDSEDVRDAKGCRWAYPPTLRVMDSEAIRRGTPPGAALRDILAYNPLRTPALRGADPFAIDKRRADQVNAILEFSNKNRPQACPALTRLDILAANLWLPARPSVRPPSGAPLAVPEPAACLQ